MATAVHHSLTDCHAAPRPAPFAGLAGWIDRMAARWRERALDRRSLATMTDRDLRDAGLTRFAVERELSRPFWRG